MFEKDPLKEIYFNSYLSFKYAYFEISLIGPLAERILDLICGQFDEAVGGKAGSDSFGHAVREIKRLAEQELGIKGDIKMIENIANTLKLFKNKMSLLKWNRTDKNKAVLYVNLR